MVNDEQNQKLTAMPTMEELKELKCRNIINHDLMGVIQAFFSSQMIPEYFSRSCIVLLPKVNNPNKMNEFRPISLSNVNHLQANEQQTQPHSPNLISFNQSGLVKGRSICENMLAQEIIHQVIEPTVGTNVIIKLDMAKHYD
ncbi:uncharacterized protein [Solanum lycopersicum]|uniref:uncharacterized protein n=1 Tax=Solanum lycopersicum TaxID=4081 RepID=UPI00374971E6